MSNVTLEEVIEQVKQLSPDEQRRLAEILAAEKPLKTIEQLVAEQGTHPLKFDDLLGPADIPPDEESAEEMVNGIYDLRSHGTLRSLE